MTESQTMAGIPLRPFYTPEHGGADYAAIGDPETYPYTRGRLRPTRARRHGWIHRELSGEGSPQRSNEQLRALLGHGEPFAAARLRHRGPVPRLPRRRAGSGAAAGIGDPAAAVFGGLLVFDVP